MWLHECSRSWLCGLLFFKQKTAYEVRISDWSSDVCASDLRALRAGLVSEIVEEEALLDRGLALADEMLATSPYGLRLSKQALNLNIDAPSLEAAMAIEDRQQVIL